MAGQAELIQDDFSVGIVRGVGPQAIDPRAVRDHINGLYEDDGGIYKRGGSSAHANKVLGLPTGRVNTVTNPSFETNTTGWSQWGTATLSRLVASNAYVGSAVLQVDKSSTAGHGVSASSVAASPGQTWSAAARVLVGSVRSMKFQVAFFNSGFVYLSGASVSFTSDGTWNRPIGSATAPATTAWVAILITDEQASTSTFYVDAAQLIQETSVSAYFDGDSPNGSWNGTAHASASTELVGAATWVWDGYFDVGRRTVAASQNDFYVFDSDEATPINLGSDGLSLPKRSELVESMLFIGGGYIYGGSRKTANYTTGTISLTNGSKTVTGSGTTWNTLVDAGMLLQRGTERVYVVASVDSTTQITLRDAYEGSTGSGISYTLSPFYKMTAGDPYKIADFYATIGKRLITGIGNTFWFSEIQKPHLYSITIAGTAYPDSHQLPEGIKITGVAAVGNTALILTTGGIWTLTGLPFDIVDAQGNTNHRLEMLSREFIAFGQSTTWQQTLIVPCIEGIFAIDGISTPRRISRPIEELWRNYVDSGYRPGKMAVYNGCLVLPVITTGGAVKDILVARLDRPVQVAGQTSYPWSRMSGPGVDCPAFTVRYDDTSGIRTLLAANRSLGRTVKCSGWWAPDPTNTLDADGTPPQWSLVTRDSLTGNHTTNYVRTIRPRYELDGTGATITGEYGFGLEQTGGPRLDQITFDNFNFAADDIEVFYPLSRTFGASDGLDPQHCQVDTETRLIRYRFRNSNACNGLRLRSLEQFIRLSNATRR